MQQAMGYGFRCTSANILAKTQKLPKDASILRIARFDQTAPKHQACCTISFDSFLFWSESCAVATPLHRYREPRRLLIA